ncbi:hypothetical protein [Oxynema aestuarii]|jgi:hypothetical protein|uniref:Uncharacterized protein n=1 Tax=Oxynema aestuarii AP17 TaxID=2064643 RepID=A0A6H1U345_9CYAN|nr:hypothetical protein [Oxynema aestuarii]QIZ73075.1 hypothetical protein HCG48_22765 [Oxynema aestuarii AP17]
MAAAIDWVRQGAAAIPDENYEIPENTVNSRRKCDKQKQNGFIHNAIACKKVHKGY